MLMTPFRCWRNRSDCEPLHSIEATPPGQTPEEYEAPDFKPVSFVCCGLVGEQDRPVAQDCYRLCFKNEVVDDMSANDLQDLTHLVAVIGQALAISATRIVNGGSVPTPTLQGLPLAETPPSPAEPPPGVQRVNPDAPSGIQEEGKE